MSDEPNEEPEMGTLWFFLADADLSFLETQPERVLEIAIRAFARAKNEECGACREPPSRHPELRHRGRRRGGTRRGRQRGVRLGRENSEEIFHSYCETKSIIAAL